MHNVNVLVYIYKHSNKINQDIKVYTTKPHYIIYLRRTEVIYPSNIIHMSINFGCCTFDHNTIPQLIKFLMFDDRYKISS